MENNKKVIGNPIGYQPKKSVNIPNPPPAHPKAPPDVPAPRVIRANFQTQPTRTMGTKWEV